MPRAVPHRLHRYLQLQLFPEARAKAIEASFIKLIFHCSGLNYVSSTGIGSFTAFLKAVKPRGGDLVLLEIQPKVYEVFQLLGFSQFFNIKENLDEAVSFFAARGEEGKGEHSPASSSARSAARS